jgi:hypothetical protein
METTSKEVKLRTLAKYGLGCAAMKLDGKDLSRYVSFAIGNKTVDEGLMKKALPDAYPIIILAGKDCRKYFLEEHNKTVMETAHPVKVVKPGVERSAISGIHKFCLVRQGRVESIEDANENDVSLFSKLFGKEFAKGMKNIGLVLFGKDKPERVLLDAVPDAKPGSIIMVHRKIACETVFI